MICMPSATEGNKFYKFWSRAMEPWDGPALITYANGYKIGARLDRNDFALVGGFAQKITFTSLVRRVHSILMKQQLKEKVHYTLGEA